MEFSDEGAGTGQQSQLRFTTLQGRGQRQPFKGAGAGATAGGVGGGVAEIDADFRILANYLAEEGQQYGSGFSMPPAKFFNLVPQQGIQGMDGGGIGGGLVGLGFNFAAHLNSRMGWGLPMPGGGGMLGRQQQQQQQQQQPQPQPQQSRLYAAPPSPSFMGMAMPHHSQAFFSPATSTTMGMGMGLPPPLQFQQQMLQQQLQMQHQHQMQHRQLQNQHQMPQLPGVDVGLLTREAAAAAGGGGLMPSAAAAAAARPGAGTDALLSRRIAMLGSPFRGVRGGGTVVSGGGSADGTAAVAETEEADAASRKKRRTGEMSDFEQRFQEQIVRRRERNRVLARQTRMRKKFFYQSLQKHMAALRSENRKLKSILMDKLGSSAEQVIEACTTELSRQVVAGSVGDIDINADNEEETKMATGGNGGEDGGSEGGKGSKRDLSKPDYRLMKSLQTAQQTFVVTEPSLPDNPIVFASDGFFKLTGYKMEQVIGRNCRFLQGPDTDQRAVATIRQAIKKGEDASVCFVNYKADGTPFWNQFFIAPLRDDKNRIVNYVGAQCLVPGPLPPRKPSPATEGPARASDGGGSGGDGSGTGGGRGGVGGPGGKSRGVGGWNRCDGGESSSGDGKMSGSGRHRDCVGGAAASRRGGEARRGRRGRGGTGGGGRGGGGAGFAGIGANCGRSQAGPEPVGRRLPGLAIRDAEEVEEQREYWGIGDAGDENGGVWDRLFAEAGSEGAASGGDDRGTPPR